MHCQELFRYFQKLLSQKQFPCILAYFPQKASYVIYLKSFLHVNMWWAGPCGIPENTGIPGFDSNTDTGIFENNIPVFFGIFV